MSAKPKYRLTIGAFLAIIYQLVIMAMYWFDCQFTGLYDPEDITLNSFIGGHVIFAGFSALFGWALIQDLGRAGLSLALIFQALLPFITADIIHRRASEICGRQGMACGHATLAEYVLTFIFLAVAVRIVVGIFVKAKPSNASIAREF